MKQRTRDLIHNLAVVGGAACLVTDIFCNVQATAAEMGSYYDSTVLAVIVVGCTTAIALTASEQACRQRHYIKFVVLMMAFLCGATYQIGLTLERVSIARDAKLDGLNDVTKRPGYRVIEAELTKVQADKAATCPIAMQSKPKAAEDITKWETAKATCTYAKGEVEHLTNAFSYLPVSDRVDPLGTRVSAYLGGYVTAEQVSLYLPAALPLSLFTFGTVLLGFGVTGRAVEAEFDLSMLETPRQKTERFVRAFQAQHGRAPRVAEIKQALGIEMTGTQARRLIARSV